MEEVRERGRLFVRPEEPRELRLTQRHLALLTNLSRFGLASAAQLAKLDGGSEQNVSRELLVLWENGYVERPPAQAASRQLYNGSFAMTYGLSRAGASLLRKNGVEVRRRVLDAIDKSHEVGWRHIAHKTGITNFMVSLELAVSERPELGLVSRSMILADAPKTRRDRRVRLTATVRIDSALRQHSVDPDELFGLHFIQSEEESYFMYEKDRGEMPVERYKSKQLTFYLKKMMTYHAANKQGIHTRDLGLPNFRVLTETTTPSRIQEMIDAVVRMTEGRGSNMFLFATEAQLAGNSPLDIVWVSGKGEQVQLTD